MGKTRTANAGVSIFKTESHVVEYKKRKSSEISIYDHGVQRGAPQPLTAASGLGDAAADGFEALVAPAPSDPPPPDAPLLGSPMRRTRSRGLAPLPLTSSITDLVSSFMA